MAALSIPVSKHTCLRVLTTAVPILMIIGITAATFRFVPVINDALTLAFRTGGAAFVWVVVVPAFLLALASTALAIRILWLAGNAPPPQQDEPGQATLR